jgi:Phage-related minor tail protein
MINLLPTVAAQPPETTGPPPSGSGSSGGKKKTQAEKDMDFVRSLLPDTQKLDIQINKLNEAMKRGTIPARDYAAAMKELTDQKMDAAAEEFKKLHPELAKFILTTEKVKEVSDKAIGPALKKLEELGDVTQNLDYRRMEMFRSILESTWTEGERTANQLKLLFQIYSEGTITLEQYQEAVDRIADANLRASIAADSSVNQMQEDMGKLADFVDSAGKNVEDALIGAFMTGEFSFKEMVASMLEQLSRLVLEILVIEPIFGRIADALRGGGGAKGSGIAGVFKGIAGLFSLGKGGKVPLPGKAAGGPVYGGSPYMVGEKGPELFIPGMSGTIIPNGAGVGSGMTFHQTINISPGLSGQIRAEIAAAMPQIKRDTTRGVMEGIQRGGRLAQAVGRKS